MTTESRTDLLTRLESAEVGSAALDGAIHRALFPSDLLMTDPGSVGPIKRDAIRQPLSDLGHVPDDVVANCIGVPVYTTSIDAALSLAGMVLPEVCWSVGQNVHHKHWLAYGLRIHEDGDVETVGRVNAATPALALCAAIIRAKGDQS